MVARVRKALDAIDWPKSKRTYVPGQGFCVGASCSPRGPLFQLPRGAPEARATRLINELVRSSCHESFLWTSLQYNRNTVAEPHEDKNNVGISFILIMGEYTGGRLIVPSRGIVTPAGAPCTALYIDGRETHQSESFDGTRYSIVAFAHNHAPLLSHQDRASLSRMGFRITASSGQGPHSVSQCEP